MQSSRMLLTGVAAVVLAVSLVAGASAAADPDLSRTLRTGGLVLVFRHAHTDQSKQDQDPVVLADCATQRNLSAQGRADARAIGRGVRRLGLRIGKVLSSPFCRTLETARLAFGRATVHRALLNTVAAAHDARWRRQIRAARRLIGTNPARGTLTVLVTHGVVVSEATGQSLEEGEAIVFRPLGKSRYVPLGDGSAPHGLIVGPDRAAWVTDGGLNAIVRVEPGTLDVRTFPLPASTGYANLNTATFDRNGVLWFTGQSGIYGRLDPKTGALKVFRAPGGTGPYGITTTPKGDVWYASLAGSHIARINRASGKATVVRPPTAGQGARRVWSDSRGRLWVSEWNAGKLARYDPERYCPLMSRILYTSDMARTVPFTDARARLSDLLDLVKREQEHVVITRNGKPAAILMSVDEWESWEETVDILSDPEAMAALAEAEEDVKAGRLYTLEEVMQHARRK